MTKKRNRAKPLGTLEERLAADTQRAREQAKKLPPGPERSAMLKRIEQNEVAAQMDTWLHAP